MGSRAQLAARGLTRGATLLHWRIAQKRGDTDTPFGPMKRCAIWGKVTEHPIPHADNHPKHGR